jgi:hypothetical protein
MKPDLVLRLTPEQVAASLNQPDISPMDFTGRPMKSIGLRQATWNGLRSSLDSFGRVCGRGRSDFG